MSGFTKRSEKIFRMLMEKPGGITGEEIAKTMEVSSRTIRSDIRKMQIALADWKTRITSSPNKGYQLYCARDIDDVRSVLFEKTENGLDDIAGRERYIICRLLENTFTDEIITQMEFAEEMFLGLSTWKSHMPGVRAKLEKFSLQIRQFKAEGIRVEGREQDLRYCMAEIMGDTSEGQLYAFVFSSIAKDDLDELLQKILSNRNLQLTDAARKSLCIYTALAIERSKRNQVVSYAASMAQKLEKNIEYGIAREIVDALFRSYGIDIACGEVYYIAQCLLTSKKIRTHGESMNKAHIEVLVKKVLREIQAKLSLDFTSDRYLIDGLTLHLSIAIARVQFHMDITNELLETIKKDYPLAFQLGILAGKVMEESDNINFNESEIGYLALHFGAAISRSGIRDGLQEKRVVIVCSAGLGVSVLLKAKIEEHFHGRIHVEKIIPGYEVNEELLSAVDFVLTTVPVETISSNKIIRINHMLMENDIQKIEERVFSKVLVQKEEIRALFDAGSFCTGKSFSSKEECLGFLTQEAIEKGLMSQVTQQSVFEREKLSTTAIGSLAAIPHPIYNDMAASFISILVLDQPVSWDPSFQVQVIFLMNIEKEKVAALETMFFKLYDYIKNQDGVRSLLQEKSYESFLSQFLKMF